MRDKTASKAHIEKPQKWVTRFEQKLLEAELLLYLNKPKVDGMVFNDCRIPDLINLK